MISITQLTSYPVESRPGASLREVRVVGSGLEGDRDWMLVDGQSVAVTQCERPRRALVQPTLATDGIGLHASRDAGSAVVTFAVRKQRRRSVGVFKQRLGVPPRDWSCRSP